MACNDIVPEGFLVLSNASIKIRFRVASTRKPISTSMRSNLVYSKQKFSPSLKLVTESAFLFPDTHAYRAIVRKYSHSVKLGQN